jgi:hypothetical protein
MRLAGNKSLTNQTFTAVGKFDSNFWIRIRQKTSASTKTAVFQKCRFDFQSHANSGRVEQQPRNRQESYKRDSKYYEDRRGHHERLKS